MSNWSFFPDWYKLANVIQSPDRWVQSAFEEYGGTCICIPEESTPSIDGTPACEIKLGDWTRLVTDTRRTAGEICLLCVVLLSRLKLRD